MIVCDFCVHRREIGQCGLGLKTPKGMSCQEFGPGLDQFCADPKDFTGPAQIVQMATFFGFQKTELRKVKLMAASAETTRS